MNHEPQPTKPKRRWFRFRLRTLLGLVTVLALLMGWVARERHQSQHERQVAERLMERYAFCTFGYPYDPVERFQKQPTRGWWRRLAWQVLGERIVETIISNSRFSDVTPLAGLKNLQFLRLDATQVSDVTPLAGLKDLQELHLDHTPVSDLSPLAGLKNLQQLWLNSTEVSDLTPLAELKNLQELWLYDTQVSDEQVESLQQALPNCEIWR